MYPDSTTLSVSVTCGHSSIYLTAACMYTEFRGHTTTGNASTACRCQEDLGGGIDEIVLCSSIRSHMSGIFVRFATAMAMTFDPKAAKDVACTLKYVHVVRYLILHQ